MKATVAKAMKANKTPKAMKAMKAKAAPEKGATKTMKAMKASPVAHELDDVSVDPYYRGLITGYLRSGRADLAFTIAPVHRIDPLAPGP